MTITMVLGLITAIVVTALVGISILGHQQEANATTISPECAAVIKNALADRRITNSEIEAIKAACASSVPEGCIDTILAAAADRKITPAEIEAIKTACY